MKKFSEYPGRGAVGPGSWTGNSAALFIGTWFNESTPKSPTNSARRGITLDVEPLLGQYINKGIFNTGLKTLTEIPCTLWFHR